jgi:hypothetical protein
MRWVALPLLLVACDASPVIRSTSVLGDTTDRVGPYRVLTEVSDADGLGSVWLHYLSSDTAVGHVRMSAIAVGVYEGKIPGQPAFTLVRYYVEVLDRGRQITDPPDLGPTSALYSFWVVGSRCAVEVECGPGEQCDTSGWCRQRAGTCQSDAQCGKSFRCGPSGSCRLASRPCTLDETCLTGEVCDKILGECVVRPRCDQDRACPLDFSCDEASALCRRSCMGAADCGPGERCAASVCAGATTCATSAACLPHLVCDPLLKLCRPEGAGLCASCALDSDCGGPTDFCLLAPGGQFCGRDCSSTTCPDGYSCSSTTAPPQCVPTTGTCPP